VSGGGVSGGGPEYGRLGLDVAGLLSWALGLDHLVAALRRAGNRSVPDGAWSGPDARRLEGELQRLRTRVARLASSLGALAERARAEARQQARASLSDPAHHTVRIDRRGDGRAVVRVGASGAHTVVVLVPGVGTDLGDLPRLEARAEAMWRYVAAWMPGAGDDLAVMAWLGYDPPDTVPGALDQGPAAEGAEALDAEVAALRRAGATRVVVVGHSYGALVAGRAAALGAGPDALVQVGAPGLGVGDTDALHLAPDACLAAATADGDPVEWVGATGLLGPDPVDVAHRMPTSGHGHSSYFDDPVFLDALGGVAVDGCEPVRSHS